MALLMCKQVCPGIPFLESLKRYKLPHPLRNIAYSHNFIKNRGILNPSFSPALAVQLAVSAAALAGGLLEILSILAVLLYVLTVEMHWSGMCCNTQVPGFG